MLLGHIVPHGPRRIGRRYNRLLNFRAGKSFGGGRERFHIVSHDTRDDGLLVARAEVLPPDIIDCKLELLGECLDALRRIVTRLHAEHPDRLPFDEPYLWDDPSWVANRLCELLPVPLKAKQMLMALPDAGMRIEIVHRYMRQNHML